MIRNYKKSPYDKQKKLKYRANKMKKKQTWPEQEFAKLLKELEIEFEIQKIVGNKIFDFYIPSANLIVEVDGDYWHGNSETNKSLNKMQLRAVNNDIYKEAVAKGYGYQIERVWESELKKDYASQKERFKKILKG